MKKLIIVPALALVMFVASASTLYVQKIILQRVFNAELSSTVLEQGELVYVEDVPGVRVGDGLTAGGTALLTAEADTLAIVTGRGASTTNTVTMGGAVIGGGALGTASGTRSVAIGDGSQATGADSFAALAGTASGFYSTALRGVASGMFALTVGGTANATNNFSMVISAATTGNRYSTASEQISLFAPGGIRLVGDVTGLSSLTASGAITAGSFSGDGSGLTNVGGVNLDREWHQIMPQSGQFSGVANAGSNDPATSEGWNSVRFRDGSDFAYYPVLPPPPGATSLVMRTLWATDAAEVSNAVQTITFTPRHTRGFIGGALTAGNGTATALSATNAVDGSVLFELTPQWAIPDGVANTNSIRQRILIQRTAADTSVTNVYLLRIKYRYE